MRERKNWTYGPLGFASWGAVGIAIGTSSLSDVIGFWGIAAGLVVVILASAVTRDLRHQARRAASKTADEIMAADGRPPVLLLRSFEDDGKPMLDNLTTWEELVVECLTRIGPVIAMGNPGESLPHAGAARTYAVDAAWRDQVSAIIDRATVVAVVLGSTDGLLEELALVDQRQAWNKVVVLVPQVMKATLEARWHAFGERVRSVGLTLPKDVSEAIVLSWDAGRNGFYPSSTAGKTVSLFSAQDVHEEVHRYVDKHLGVETPDVEAGWGETVRSVASLVGGGLLTTLSIAIYEPKAFIFLLTGIALVISGALRLATNLRKMRVRRAASPS